MNIGIDLHGVIDTNLEEFKPILSALSSEDLKISIVSGPPKEELAKELTNLDLMHGSHFHEILSVVDYLKGKGAEMWLDKRNTWWASYTDWWSSKHEICINNDITLLIDNSFRYSYYFTGETHHIALFTNMEEVSMKQPTRKVFYHYGDWRSGSLKEVINWWKNLCQK